MNCPGCGAEVPSEKKYCSNCGAALGEPTVRMPQVPPPPPPPPPVGATLRMPQVAPQGPPVTPYPPVVARGGRGKRVAIAVVIAVLVVGGAVAGVVAWRVSVANRTVAKVVSIDLTGKSGEELALERVPLDTGLKLEAAFRAKYPEGGSATIKLSVVDDSGDELVGKTFTVASSDDVQRKSVEFSMSQSSGKPLEAKAALKVERNGTNVADDATLSYTAVKGKGKALKFEEAKEKARRKLEEATNAVKELASMGLEATDLADRLQAILGGFDEATTAADMNTIYDSAQAVLDEAGARKAAGQQQDQARDTCKANQAKVRAMIVDYYNRGGNMPNSMSDLGSLPACPSGGTYSYEASDTTPATLTVYCSVHGSL